MNKNLLIIALIVASIFLVACQGVDEQAPIDNTNEQETREHEELEEKNNNESDNQNQEEESEFTFYLQEDNSLNISIMDWDNEKDIKSILGQPIDESIEIIGEGGDTFKGSKIKRSKYDGLKLELMSPKDKDSYYIMTMISENEDYVTKRGIKVGDSFESILEAYPNVRKLEIWEENKPIEVYRFDIQGVEYIDFYIIEGVINKIIVGYELQ